MESYESQIFGIYNQECGHERIIKVYKEMINLGNIYPTSKKIDFNQEINIPFPNSNDCSLRFISSFYSAEFQQK